MKKFQGLKQLFRHNCLYLEIRPSPIRKLLEADLKKQVALIAINQKKLNQLKLGFAANEQKIKVLDSENRLRFLEIKELEETLTKTSTIEMSFSFPSRTSKKGKRNKKVSQKTKANKILSESKFTKIVKRPSKLKLISFFALCGLYLFGTPPIERSARSSGRFLPIISHCISVPQRPFSILHRAIPELASSEWETSSEASTTTETSNILFGSERLHTANEVEVSDLNKQLAKISAELRFQIDVNRGIKLLYLIEKYQRHNPVHQIQCQSQAGELMTQPKSNNSFFKPSWKRNFYVPEPSQLIVNTLQDGSENQNSDGNDPNRASTSGHIKEVRASRLSNRQLLEIQAICTFAILFVHGHGANMLQELLFLTEPREVRPSTNLLNNVTSARKCKFCNRYHIVPNSSIFTTCFNKPRKGLQPIPKGLLTLKKLSKNYRPTLIYAKPIVKNKPLEQFDKYERVLAKKPIPTLRAYHIVTVQLVGETLGAGASAGLYSFLTTAEMSHVLSLQHYLAIAVIGGSLVANNLLLLLKKFYRPGSRFMPQFYLALWSSLGQLFMGIFTSPSLIAFGLSYFFFNNCFVYLFFSFAMITIDLLVAILKDYVNDLPLIKTLLQFQRWLKNCWERFWAKLFGGSNK